MEFFLDIQSKTMEVRIWRLLLVAWHDAGIGVHVSVYAGHRRWHRLFAAA